LFDIGTNTDTEQNYLYIEQELERSSQVGLVWDFKILKFKRKRTVHSIFRHCL